MEITITFEIPDKAIPVMATLDYFDEGGLCCKEVHSQELNEIMSRELKEIKKD